MAHLDGKEPVKAQTSFDPHGDRTRHPHTHSSEHGYTKVAEAPVATVAGSHDDPKPATADGEVHEYPKHIKVKDADGEEATVVAHSAEEEAKFTAPAEEKE